MVKFVELDKVIEALDGNGDEEGNGYEQSN